MVPPKYLSVRGGEVLPPSVVLKAPPPVVPIQYSLGRLADPATAMLRPPRKMPISRQLSAANASVSKDLAATAWARAAGTATSAAPKARTQTRMRLSTESLRTGSERGLQLTPSPSDWQDLGGAFPPGLRIAPTSR